MRNSGKGDSQRPLSVSIGKFNENWDKIFGKQPVAKKVAKQTKKQGKRKGK